MVAKRKAPAMTEAASGVQRSGEDRRLECTAKLILLWTRTWLGRWDDPQNRGARRYWRSSLPYSFQEIPGNRFIPTTRQYLPLGVTERAWVSYEAHDDLALPASALDPTAAWLDGGDTYWLFDESNPPWKGRRECAEYERRLTAMLRGVKR